MKNLSQLITICMLLSGIPGLAAPKKRPSFDCAKASGPVEQMICKEPTLSVLDHQIARSFKNALKTLEKDDAQTEDLKNHQRQWAQNREFCFVFINSQGTVMPTNHAGDHLQCLEKTYRARIDHLNGIVSSKRMGGPGPVQPISCPLLASRTVEWKDAGQSNLVSLHQFLKAEFQTCWKRLPKVFREGFSFSEEESRQFYASNLMRIAREAKGNCQEVASHLDTFILDQKTEGWEPGKMPPRLAYFKHRMECLPKDTVFEDKVKAKISTASIAAQNLYEELSILSKKALLLYGTRCSTGFFLGAPTAEEIDGFKKEFKAITADQSFIEHYIQLENFKLRWEYLIKRFRGAPWLHDELPDWFNKEEVLSAILPSAEKGATLSTCPFGIRIRLWKNDEYLVAVQAKELLYLGLIQEADNTIQVSAKLEFPLKLSGCEQEGIGMYGCEQVFAWDLAEFKLNEKETGFGLRTKMYYPAAAGGFQEYEYLYVFRQVENIFQMIFKTLMAFEAESAGVWSEDGTRERVRIENKPATIKFLKSKTNGFYRLEKRSDKKSMVFTFDGKNYSSKDKEILRTEF